MNKSDTDAINLKPNKPDIYRARQVFLAISTYLFNIDQYLILTQLNSSNTSISDENRIALRPYTSKERRKYGSTIASVLPRY